MYSLAVQIRKELNRSFHGFYKQIRDLMVGRVGFEPTTIGLKVRYDVNIWLIIQLLTGMPVATYARLCTTVLN